MPGLLDYIPSQSDVQRTLADLLAGPRNRLADLMPRGLLGAAQQYISDAAPGGALNREWTPENVRTAGEVASMMPNPAGDVISGLLAVDDLRKGDYGSAALNSLGLVPFIPAMGGMIKGPLGRIPETGAETRKLAEMLKRAGENAGYYVSHSGSAISPSQYVTFAKLGDDAGDMTRQVRISNHADKYPELANGVRTSVDPSTEVSFEQAVNWLEREGFPTSLSTRYKGIPTWEQYYSAKRAASPKVDPQVLLNRLEWKWANDPSSKYYGGAKPTMEDVLRDHANVISK